MRNKYFKAQALALVMIVLVVASVIGVSLFSRLSKDKQASLDEQDSSIALSQSDATLDFFVGASIDSIEEVLGTEDVRTANDSAEIKELLGLVGVDEDSITVDESWCEGENSMSVSLEYSDYTDYIEFSEGSVAVINLEGGSVEGECILKVRLKAVESTAVFIIQRVFDDEGTVTEEVDGYCIQSGTEEACPSDIEDVEYESSLSSISWDLSEDVHYIDFNLGDEINNDDTVEIRIMPIKGTLALSNELEQEDCINKQFNYIKITAEANCNNSYRGEQMYLPGSGCLGYSTLFDYGIYDSGLFTP